MRFNLEETVNGADLRPNATVLTFSRERLPEVLGYMGEYSVFTDAFVVDRQRVSAVVFFPEDGTDWGDLLLKKGISSEQGYFRLRLRGNRLSEGRGLAALWESVLSEAKVPLRLSCADGCGITQYLPAASRSKVLFLLEQTFGIRVV